VQTVHGGSDLRIVGNYMHDNNMQPLFLGKDGDVTGIEIRDNLSVRNRVGPNPTQVTSQIIQPHDVTIRNNTIVDEGGLTISWGPSFHGANNPPPAPPYDNVVDHNVFSTFVPYDYSSGTGNRVGIFANPAVLLESYNVLGDGSWNWLSRLGLCSIAIDEPTFAAPAQGDCRLTVNTCGGYQAGVTWRAADRKFGPR
jgi:hypothetical protein